MKFLKKHSLSFLISSSIIASFGTALLTQNAYSVEKSSSAQSSFQRASNPLDLETKLKLSEFVFSGKIADIQYRLSREGIPHTFVTYYIEKVLKGKYNDDKITLRFAGGIRQIDKENYEVLEVSHVPQFEKESADILFAQQNGNSLCPLVACANGRFKIDKNGFVTTDDGKKLGVTEQDTLVLLATESSKKEEDKDYGGEDLESKTETQSAKPISQHHFIEKVLQIAEKYQNSKQVLNSVELEKPFSMGVFKQVGYPKVAEQEIKEDKNKTNADREEEAFLKKNGNNPVINY